MCPLRFFILMILGIAFCFSEENVKFKRENSSLVWQTLIGLSLNIIWTSLLSKSPAHPKLNPKWELKPRCQGPDVGFLLFLLSCFVLRYFHFNFQQIEKGKGRREKGKGKSNQGKRRRRRRWDTYWGLDLLRSSQARQWRRRRDFTSCTRITRRPINPSPKRWILFPIPILSLSFSFLNLRAIRNDIKNCL